MKIREYNICGNCRYAFLNELGENCCHEGCEQVNKYGGLTECYRWESK